MNKEIIPGKIYRRNTVLPVLTKLKGVNSQITSEDLSRSVIRGCDFICAFCDKTRNRGVLLDKAGNETIITKEELNSKFIYRNSLLSKKTIPSYIYRRGGDKSLEEVLVDFYLDSKSSRYKDWNFSEEFYPTPEESDELNEACKKGNKKVKDTINEGCKKKKTNSNESNCDYPEELKSLVEDKLVKLWKDNEGITDTEFVDISSEIMEKGYSFEDIFNCFQDCVESDETELDESSKEKYIKNGFYISEDGKFSFVVTSSSNGSVSIIDVSDEENPKESKVDVSDLELAKATLVEVIKDFDK